MVNFEFIEDVNENYTNFKVMVNGIVDESSFKSDWNKKISVDLHLEKVCNIVKNEKISSLLNDIDEITIPLDVEYFPETIESNDYAEISIVKEERKYKICVKFQYNYEFWSRGYTIPDLVEILEGVSKSNNDIIFELKDIETTLNGFEFSKEIQDVDNRLIDEISIYMNLIQEIFRQASDIISNRHISEDSYFEFSIEGSAQTIAKQYLIYFIQFLEDLGIEAESKIIDKENNILFEVIPKDKTIALKNIRDCLNLYLSLIDNKELETFEDYSNIAVMQLKANIAHLKSQLMLANSIIEQKQITIDLLNSGKVVIPQKEKNEIEILNGIIVIKEFEWNGLTINPAKIIDFLKRRI